MMGVMAGGTTTNQPQAAGKVHPAAPTTFHGSPPISMVATTRAPHQPTRVEMMTTNDVNLPPIYF